MDWNYNHDKKMSAITSTSMNLESHLYSVSSSACMTILQFTIIPPYKRSYNLKKRHVHVIVIFWMILYFL